MIEAYVLIKTKPATAKGVAQKINKIKGVNSAYAMWGLFDIVAHVQAKDLDNLDILVCHKIKRITNIVDTNTMICKNKDIPDKP